MIFLNLAILGGLAGALIPVIIHLITKNRFRVVKWGASHLLIGALKQNTRRLRLEHLILLLVRTAIPVFLVLAMARPVLKGLEALLGNAKTSVVVLLDNSYSMNAGDAARTHLSQAREAAGHILDNLPRGSEAALVWMAGSASGKAPEPTFDMGLLRRELDAASEGFGVADAAGSFELAAGLLSRMHHLHREIVAISDLQETSWGKDAASALDRSVAIVKALPVQPLTSLLRVGEEVRNNVCVEDLSLSRQVLGMGQKLQVRATVRNLGEVGYPALRVYFRADGQERAASQIALSPGERAQVLFTHQFDSAGSHVLEVYADADPLKADNGLMAGVSVWDRLPVLLISGDISENRLRSETGFLEIALRPHASANASGRATLADMITTSTIDARALDAAMLAQSRVAVLANVAQLSDAQVKALTEFVRDGGGLLVFPGNRVSAQWYNAKLCLEGRGLIPYRMDGLGGLLRPDSTPAAISSQRYKHPALDIFNDPKNGSLSGAAVRTWHRLGRPDAAGVQAEVVARLDSGDPFLVESKSGEGHVIQCSLPCDADWSDLPSHGFYLPLMQQMVIYLASKVYPPRNVEVGDVLGLFLPAAEAGKSVTLVTPAGERFPVPVVLHGAKAATEWRATSRPGLYVLETVGGSAVHFVVSTSRRESDLKLVSDSDAKELAERTGASLVGSWKEYAGLDRKRRDGLEFYPGLIYAVLGLVFLEIVLEQLFGGLRRR